MIKNGAKMISIALLAIFFPALLFAVPADKTITWEGGGQGKVTFEGKEHAEKGYACDSCHPSLFQMKKGATKMTMDALNKGQFCGHCHNGKAAFSTSDQKECHECHKSKKKHHEHDDKHHD